MSFFSKIRKRLHAYFTLIFDALRGKETDYTSVNLRQAIVLLAIPMMMEMMMESVFALVDLYFVGHLPNGSHAIQIVGLTESVLTVVYSLAIGVSMAATAVVARRIGEKAPEKAAMAAAQSMLAAGAITLIISIFGFIYAKELLLWMGASEETALQGISFVRIMMGGSLVIMFLFLINGIFRGAGNAAIAMKSLWIANIANILLCPLLIRGWGPVQAFGLTGAAMATTIGRSLGVVYQLYHLFRRNNALPVKLIHFYPAWNQMKSIIKIAAPAILQYVIASCSWIFLTQLVAKTGGDHGSAGYQTALRLMMFFMLPAWGLSNAAATLVGQNLGAKKPERAEKAVFMTIQYIFIFMAFVTVLFLTSGNFFIALFTSDPAVIKVAMESLHIMSYGFVIYGAGMVLISAFNGAGDTVTPTKINFVGFWLFQIPLAYLLANTFKMGPTGVFVAIPVTEIGIAITAFLIFRKGKWKNIQL